MIEEKVCQSISFPIMCYYNMNVTKKKPMPINETIGGSEIRNNKKE